MEKWVAYCDMEDVKYANPPKLEVEHWVYHINYIYSIPLWLQALANMDKHGI